MTYCIDDMWGLFKKYVSDHDIRLAFAKELIVDSEYENLSGNPYCSSLMYFLADHEDEYFLELHCVREDDTVAEVIENLDFHIKHNNLTQERRYRIFALWLKQTGKFASSGAHIEALKVEEEVLQKRLADIHDEKMRIIDESLSLVK